MSITRLQNIYSSNTGRILYVAPDDFDASDAISNRGNSPLRPFKTIQRALLEAARFSYVPGNGGNNDRFDQFTIMLEPGDHVIDNRPGLSDPTQAPILSDASNFNLQDPNNDLYKFNSTRGGVIVPRGTSIIGVDLRKTKILPKFIPDPTATDGGTLLSNYPNTGVLNSGTTIVEDDTRSAVFRVTGGCYFWQFTFFDGDPNGVYTGLPNPSGVTPTLVSSSFSHHKLTNFEYACFYDLSLYYQKASRAFSNVGIPITDQLGPRVEENRIVGPGGIQADTTRISTITFSGNIATATTVLASDGVTRLANGFSVGSQIRIFNSDDTVSGSVSYNGTYQILAVSSSQNDSVLDQFSYQLSGIPNANAQPIGGAYLACELETDTVDSASPYIFNCSIRSTYGVCGMHANGAMTTGFKSMVVAQYTGICLQKDDRAFVRACPVGSTNYQDGSITTCGGATLRPAHQDINAQYKKGWRNYHVKASNDGYIQVVSVFAVGFADQFIVDSGGDMSIANSDSNFGNTALRAKGFKSKAFTKDVSGVITHIIPPANVPSTQQTINWLPFDIQLTRNYVNGNRLYVYNANSLSNPPTINVLGYTVGGQVNDTLYVGLGNTVATAVVNPSGPATKVGAGNTGSPVQWDSSANNWYISVNAGSTIVSTLQQSQYASPSQVTTPVSYFKRLNDTRVPSDKLYRLRLVIPKTSTFASPPQTGFVIQPLTVGQVSNSYTNTYYIFNVETYQSLVIGSQDGIYYLTALLGNISPTATNFNDTKFSQNVNQLYPTEDIDNPVSDPTASRSIADNITIGLITTTDGSNSVTTRSITKEAIIQWCKETNNSYTISDNSGSYNYWDPSYSITVNGNTLTSASGTAESRLIDTPDVSVELRRPSIIRAGNQTFEYTGFGPGNYSTGFPSRQTVVLTQDQVRLSQSQRENGGISFYSGLNSNGDLYIGNTVINPVTGTTTTVNNPTTSSASDPNSPVYTSLTLTKALTVIGDTNNNVSSIFFGPLSVSGLTTINNNLQINPTWSSAGVQQTGIKLNVTDNGSLSNSNLLDLQVSGASKFSVDKNGNTIITGTLTGAGVTGSITNYARQSISVSNSGPAGTGLTYSTSTGLVTFGTSTLQQVTTAGSTSSVALSLTNSTTSSSTSTGALVVTGGVGIGGALNVGGNISGSAISGTTGTFSSSVSASSYGTVNATSVSSSGSISGTSISGSSLSVSGAISGSTGSFTSSTATSSTSTGALVVTGGVGIGGALNVGGDITAFASSDKQLKDNISPIQNALQKIESVSGNTFTWNHKSNYNGKPDVGVIAQEIKEVLPEVVAQREDGYLAVRYEKLVPLLIEAVKELSEKVRKLENDITK